MLAVSVIQGGVRTPSWMESLVSHRPALADTVQDQGVFFRLVSKYQYGAEIIDFDIVVGCSVRVTRWSQGGSSFDATRDPVIFAKAATDGSAIAQIVPSACMGETTANGRVPDDFLPGAIWFPSTNDFSFGIAYVTEDAFESPNGKLKFLGAKILKATRADYESFEPIAATNLIDPRPFTRGDPKLTDAEIKAHLWDVAKIKEWRPRINCYLVERNRITDAKVRAGIAEHWPIGKPKYWTPPKEQLLQLIDREELNNKAIVDGRPMSSYFFFGGYDAHGFATRSGGGRLYSEHKAWDKRPPNIFPLKADEGVPWIAQDLKTASLIYRDIDLSAGANQGLAYCYSTFRDMGPLAQAHLPDYWQRQFRTRIDGELVAGEEEGAGAAPDRPVFFFEGDEYFYRQYYFGLQ